MSRASMTPVLTLSLLLLAVLFSGCGEEAPAVNNSTLSNGDISPTPRPNMATSDTAVASGRVFFEGMETSGGVVEATSLDGTDWVSTNTNESGFYALNLKKEISYRVTAMYNGRQHTIWPVQVERGIGENINLTVTPTSAISGVSSSGSGWPTDLYIEAMPLGGGAPASGFTDINGNFTIEVPAWRSYDLNGMVFDEWGDRFGAYFRYRNSSDLASIAIGEDETVLVDYVVLWHHAPKSFFMNYSADGFQVFRPSGPVPASGHVYRNGQPVAYATVVAVSKVGGNQSWAVTNNLGAYTLELTPRSIYSITVKDKGLQHTVKPVFVWENSDNEYRAFLNSYQFDINLTTPPGSMINGVWIGEPEQNWSDMLIEARPRTGSSPIYAVPDTNGNFSLLVEPLVYYDLSLASIASGEQIPHTRFLYHTGLGRTSYLLYPNETVLVDYSIVDYG